MLYHEKRTLNQNQTQCCTEMYKELTIGQNTLQRK